MANISLSGIKGSGLTSPKIGNITVNNRINIDKDVNINQDYIEINYSDPNAETLINPNAYIEHPMAGYLNVENPYAASVGGEDINAEVAALGVSVVFGLLDVVENLGDAVLMAGGLISVAEASIFHPEEVGKIKKDISDMVSYDWTEGLYDASVDAMGIDYDSSHGAAHTMGSIAGTMAGYTALSIVTSGAGAVVNAVVGGLSAWGSSSERALQSGATFEQAEVVGIAAGGLGAGTGVLSEKIRTAASGAKSIGDIGKFALEGAGAAAVEPIANSGIEYLTYGKDKYDNYFDYYMNAGGFQGTLMAAGIGGASTAVKATQGYLNNKKINDASVEGIKLGEANADLNESSSGGNMRIVNSDDAYVKLNSEQKKLIDSFHNMMINDRLSDADAIEGFERQLIYSMASGNEDAEKIINKLIEYKKIGREIHYRNLSNYPGKKDVSCYCHNFKTVFMKEIYVDGSDVGALSVYFHETGHLLHHFAIGDNVPNDWKLIKTNTQKRISQANKGVFGNIVKKVRTSYSEAMDIARNDLVSELAQSGMDIDSYEKYLTNFYTRKIASGDIEKSIIQNPNISDAAKLLVVNEEISANDLALSQIRNEICSRADKIFQNNSISSSNYVAIEDIVNSFYDGKTVDINGIELGTSGYSNHSKEYYAKSKVKSYTEIIANFTALKCDPNSQEALKILRDIIGDDSYNYIEKQYEYYTKYHNYTPEQILFLKGIPNR